MRDSTTLSQLCGRADRFCSLDPFLNHTVHDSHNIRITYVPSSSYPFRTLRYAFSSVTEHRPRIDDVTLLIIPSILAALSRTSMCYLDNSTFHCTDLRSERNCNPTRDFTRGSRSISIARAHREIDKSLSSMFSTSCCADIAARRAALLFREQHCYASQLRHFDRMSIEKRSSAHLRYFPRICLRADRRWSNSLITRTSAARSPRLHRARFNGVPCRSRGIPGGERERERERERKKRKKERRKRIESRMMRGATRSLRYRI